MKTSRGLWDILVHIGRGSTGTRQRQRRRMRRRLLPDGSVFLNSKIGCVFAGGPTGGVGELRLSCSFTCEFSVVFLVGSGEEPS